MNYIVWANVYLACFYGFYWFFLRKETFFELNRWYLMASILLAFGIPLLGLKNLFWTPKVELFSGGLDFEAQVNLALSGLEESKSSAFGWVEAFPILTLIYALGCVFFLIKLILQVVKIRKQLKGPMAGQAFSFFHRIHIDSAIGNYAKVLEHEQVHVSQLHSVDVLLIEIVKIVNWFNPVVYLMGRSAKLNHEYIADERTANGGPERILYAETLLNQAFDATNYSLTNHFINESFLKNRIAMLFKNKSKKSVLSRFLILIPILILLVACQNEEPKLLEVSSDGLSASESGRLNDKPLVVAAEVSGSDTSDVLFSAVEVPPVPSGGMNNFLKFISENYKYPKEAENAEVNGRVIVAFVVEADGTLSDVRMVRDLGYGTGEEAIRVIKSSEKWNPGIQNGHVVRVQYTLPIVLNLSSDK